MKYLCSMCNTEVQDSDVFCKTCGSLFDGSTEVQEALKHPDELGEGANKRKKLTNPEDVWSAVMLEFKRGTLWSGSGSKVTNEKQAKAIAMAETERFRK